MTMSDSSPIFLLAAYLIIGTTCVAAIMVMAGKLILLTRPIRDHEMAREPGFAVPWRGVNATVAATTSAAAVFGKLRHIPLKLHIGWSRLLPDLAQRYSQTNGFLRRVTGSPKRIRIG